MLKDMKALAQEIEYFKDHPVQGLVNLSGVLVFGISIPLEYFGHHLTRFGSFLCDYGRHKKGQEGINDESSGNSDDLLFPDCDTQGSEEVSPARIEDPRSDEEFPPSHGSTERGKMRKNVHKIRK